MQEATDWTEKYYSPKALEVLRERRGALTPEQKTEIGAQWKALLTEIQSALDREVQPDSASMGTTAATVDKLKERFRYYMSLAAGNSYHHQNRRSGAAD